MSDLHSNSHSTNGDTPDRDHVQGEGASGEPDLRRHIPVLDGLRGLAILLVLIFHTTVIKATAPIDDYYFQMGASAWIGVDLFFVLSGFLITGILYDTKGSTGFFRSFYARRMLRIFPLYYAVIAFCIFLHPHLSVFNYSGVPDPWPRQWWYWLYLSNFLIAEEGFRHLMLGPTWSLAIEEQFYLVWPLLIFFLSRRCMMALCGLLIAIAVSLRIYMLSEGFHTTSIYVLTPSRLDPLAIGAFIALLLRGSKSLKSYLPWAFATFFISGSILSWMLLKGLINKKMAFMVTYGYLTVAVFSGAILVLLLAAKPGSFFGRLFTSRVLKTFGKYSYAIYLFNRPLVYIVESYIFHYKSAPQLLDSSIPGQLIFKAIVIMLSLGLAMISWYTFERHFLKLKRYFPSTKSTPVVVNLESDTRNRSTTVNSAVNVKLG